MRRVAGWGAEEVGWGGGSGVFGDMRGKNVLLEYNRYTFVFTAVLAFYGNS